MPGEAVSVFASFHPAEGQDEAVLAVLRAVMVGTRAEPGNEVYDLYRSDDGAFRLIERYTDADAVQAHRDSEHYRRYRAGIAELLARPIEVVVMHGIDVR